jgi:formylglycine-generating enzyme required for sulfatase activity
MGVYVQSDGPHTSPAQSPTIPELVLIPAGPFLMGSDPRRDPHAHEREQPQHSLFLPDFYLARVPVTNAQYAAFVQSAGYPSPEHWPDGNPPPGKEEHPVVNASWYDALAYCRWLSQLSGRSYRLPSEAEWEKAARGEKGRLYPWGDAWDAGRCNSKESGRDDTTPGGAFPLGASPYGLLDMAGNVYQWTLSLWGRDIKEPAFGYPYDPADGREELEADQGVLRVLRGGAYFYDARYARTAHRVKSYPDYRVRTRGFRVCCDGPRQEGA